MRTVYVCSLKFPVGSAGLWGQIVEWIAGWYRRRTPETPLPSDWAANPTTITRGPLHSLDASVTSLAGDASELLREIRWRYPDDYDPTLVWSVDVSLFSAREATLFTLLLRIASDSYDLLPARFQLGSPRIVRDLVARGDASFGGHQLDVGAKRVEADEVSELVTLIRAEDRAHPIIVISPDPFKEVPIVDPEAIAATLAGLASIRVLASKWAGFALSDDLGKRFSCYNGAVRIYWPRFNVEIDPSFHRLWLASDIAAYGGSEPLAKHMLRLLAAAASFRYVEPEPLRSFRRKVEDGRIATLKAEKNVGYDALFDEYVKLDSEARDLRERVEALTNENENFRQTLAAVWSAEGASPRTQTRPTPGVDDRPEPKTVEQAVEEAQRRTTHIIYLSDASDSARESPFKQPDKAYSALLAIDDVAKRWAEQLGGGPKVGSIREAFRQRGFEYKDGISSTSEGRWGDEYTYEYEGTRVVFGPHITIGAKQADKCLSIHLHWDEKKRRVVVAHVGRHKTNTKT